MRTSTPAEPGTAHTPDTPGPAAALGASGQPSARFGPRAAWPALALYVGLRAVAMLALWRAADAFGRDLGSRLTAWDGGHYLILAMRGYDTAIPLKPDGSLATTNLAFFPLYPGLIAALDPVLPGGSRITAIAVSWAAGVAAAWGLYAVGAQLRDRPTGIILAGLWAVVPHAVVESMGYTETLFTALAAWSLFALLRRRWVTAGVLCLFAGLTRSVAIALIAAVGLAALVAVCQRRDGWRPWLGGALAPLGFLGFAAWVGHRLGRFDGYVYVQRVAWHASFDAGEYAVTYTTRILTQPQELGFYVTTLVVLLALALLVLIAIGRVPWPLVIYAAVMFAAVVGVEGYYHTMARHLLPAFPLLLPVAYALAAARRSTVIVVLALLTAVSAWYGVYLCLIWQHSP
ncbi:MAG TPA: hypothetical protein VH502_11780 [Actinoplanes sp.]